MDAGAPVAVVAVAVIAGVLRWARWARYAERRRQRYGRGPAGTTGGGGFSVAQYQEDKARAAAQPDAPQEAFTYDIQIRLAEGLVVRHQDASTAMLCRELGIGMLPAAGLLEELERRGVVRPMVGGRREVLVAREPEDERPKA